MVLGVVSGQIQVPDPQDRTQQTVEENHKFRKIMLVVYDIQKRMSVSISFDLIMHAIFILEWSTIKSQMTAKFHFNL